MIVALLCLQLVRYPAAVEYSYQFGTEAYEKQVLDDVDLLARLLTAECGASWCSDEMVYYTGSVVLNRVKHADFPDTIKDVVYQEGQYATVMNGSIDNRATERCYDIANRLIGKGSMLPDNVVYQANFLQGSGLYEQVQNMYFCYR